MKRKEGNRLGGRERGRGENKITTAVQGEYRWRDSDRAERKYEKEREREREGKKSEPL